MCCRLASIGRDFDRKRAEKVFEYMYMMYIIAALAMWGIDVWAMVESEFKTFYWAASIVSGICLSIQAAVAVFLYKKMKTFDNDESTEQLYMKTMKFQDVMALVTAIVCIVAIVTAGWIGFTYEENNSDVQSREEYRNGKIAAGLMALNLLGDIMAIRVVWANDKFRAYLKTRPGFLNPDQFERHAVDMACA